MVDNRNKFRRADKEARKYYFSPDVVDLIEQEHTRTGYPRSIILEILVRENLGKPPEEAIASAVPEKRAAPQRRPKTERRVDLGI